MTENLTNKEKFLSKAASEILNFEVLVYQDGDWICQPFLSRLSNGYGETFTDAIFDCFTRNKRKSS